MQDLMNFLATHLVLTYSLAIVLVLLVLVEIARIKSMHYCIDVSQAVQLINRQHAKVLDLRPVEAYQSQHIIDAISMPGGELTKDTKKVDKLKAHPLILVCNSGQESQKVAALLQKKGYNIYSLTGGMRAWAQADMPLTKG